MVALRCAGASAKSCWNRSTAHKWLSLASFDSAPVGTCLSHRLQSLEGCELGDHGKAPKARKQNLCAALCACVCAMCFCKFLPFFLKRHQFFDLSSVLLILLQFRNYSTQDAAVAAHDSCALSSNLWLRTSQVFRAWCSFLKHIQYRIDAYMNIHLISSPHYMCVYFLLIYIIHI